jgi:HEAT repeat protein
MSAVEDAPPNVQEAAVRALGQIGDERATEALVGALNADDDDVRQTAMTVLIDWRLGEVDEQLAEALENEDADTARRAAVVLAQHTPAASGELIRAIGTTEVEVPGEASAVRTRLEQTVEDASTGDELRRMAITALRWVGTEASLDALAPLVDVGSKYAEVASKTIGHIGQRLARMEEDQLEVGEEMQPSQATELLLDVYETAETDDLRLTAAAGLAVMGGQPVEPLIEMLKRADTDEQRAWLIATIASIGKPAVENLLDARGRADDAELRNWMVSALELIGDARALDLIDQLPQTEQPDEKKVRAGREIFSEIQKHL